MPITQTSFIDTYSLLLIGNAVELVRLQKLGDGKIVIKPCSFL